MAFDLATAKPVEEKNGFDLSTAKPVDEPVDFSLGETIKNIPSSAAGVASDIWQTVRHPVETAKGIGTLGKGLADKAIGASMEYGSSQRVDALQRIADGGASPQDWITAGIDPNTPKDQLNEALSSAFDEESLRQQGIKEKMASVEPEQEAVDQVWQHIQDRYGSMDNFKQTVMDDPVGVGIDIAGLISVAGAGAKSALMRKTGAAANPVNVAKNTAKYVSGKAIPENMPRKLYESAAKFSTTLPDKKRGALIETALQNKIMPTVSGTRKLEGLVDNLNLKIDTLISDADLAGKSIPRAAIYKHLKELRRKKGGVRLDAPADLESINKYVQSFESYLDDIGKNRLTPSELQNLKVEAYKSINWDAKRMTGTPIKEDVYKTVARGAKEGIEQMVPQVKETNAQLGSLLELQPHLQRAANRIDNRNVVSLNAPMNIGAGGLAGGAPGVAAGVAASIFEMPKVKSALAIILKEMKKDSTLAKYFDNNQNLSDAIIASVLAGRTEESK